MGLLDEFLSAAFNIGGRLEKGLREFNENAQAPDTSEVDARIEKAAAEAIAHGKNGFHSITDDNAREPKAYGFDPFDLVAVMGYRERPSLMSYKALEMIGRGVPVVSDVITARTKQVLMFCDLPEDRHSPGFQVRLRDRDAKVTKATEKRSHELEQTLLCTGYHDDNKPYDSVSLKTFAKQTVEDSLIYDQMTFEVVPDRKGRPSYLIPVDASTIRLVDPGARSAGDMIAVQVINGAIVESFSREELAFCIRNPRTGIRSFGYGLSEIETLVREITGFLWSMDYNRKFFVNGSATKGILNFKGPIPDKQLRAFRRQWYAMVAGVSNAWRTPITNAEELQWIPMQLNNRDMEYNAWMDFLIKIVCARYSIAPEEVNFQYGNTGQSSSLSNSGSTIEQKLEASRDLGLRPLVRWFFEQLNIWFLQRLDPDFEVVPVGLDSKGAEEETELLNKQTGTYLMIDEAREAAGLEPLPDGMGQMVRDPTWLQFQAQKQQAAMMAQQGMMGGGMGGPEEQPPVEGEEEYAVPSGFDPDENGTATTGGEDHGFEVEPGEPEAGPTAKSTRVSYTIDLE